MVIRVGAGRKERRGVKNGGGLALGEKRDLTAGGQKEPPRRQACGRWGPAAAPALFAARLVAPHKASWGGHGERQREPLSKAACGREKRAFHIPGGGNEGGGEIKKSFACCGCVCVWRGARQRQGRSPPERKGREGGGGVAPPKGSARGALEEIAGARNGRGLQGTTFQDSSTTTQKQGGAMSWWGRKSSSTNQFCQSSGGGRSGKASNANTTQQTQIYVCGCLERARAGRRQTRERRPARALTAAPRAPPARPRGSRPRTAARAAAVRGSGRSSSARWAAAPAGTRDPVWAVRWH